MALTTNEMANFDELSVDKRVEGKYKLHRTLMKLGYIFIPLAIIVLMFATGWGAFALLIFIPLFIAGLLQNLLFRIPGDMLIFHIHIW